MGNKKANFCNRTFMGGKSLDLAEVSALLNSSMLVLATNE